ncbi:MAG: primosomal replication protein N [Nitrosospira sp.]|nr:primosomal replication protein N [Nitrosospira sp.]MDW7642196.1 primosomal replication protein N [Nitrosomonadaceae bacterium]MBI0407227.1 primosomal replication protein N [Nitrosospira sp.]MBI0414831.1 primosomal replication protein N [Nitrosospira sp.]MBI0415406.1 primosomal replication protein N [Nitrosospira sp.]
MGCNQLEICGKIIEMKKLRYTPIGIAIAEFKVSHISQQLEAEVLRQIECEISAVALAQIAKSMTDMKIGTVLKLIGFLARRSRINLQLVLHVNSMHPI